MRTSRQDALIAAATDWATRDERVRALLLKGSLGRGEGDERSDLDLVVVTRPGRLEELWAERERTAAGLDRWLGGFDEVPWQAPNTFIGFYDGPLKVDFFYKDGEPAADPWLRDGFVALFDPEGLASGLGERVAAASGLPELDGFDPHAWDWIWWMDVKLSRGGQSWLVYLELVKFVETMLLGGHNALTPEPWRGASHAELRLPAELRGGLESALPAAPRPDDLAEALARAVEQYLVLRRRLAAERGMPLAEELARQILPRLYVGTVRPIAGAPR